LSRFALLVVVVVAVMVVGCHGPAPARVSLSESHTAPDRLAATTTQPLPLRVAVAAILSPRANLDAYDPLLRYIEARLGGTVELVQRTTYAEVNELVRLGAVDVAFVCSGAFVEGQRQFGMELLVTPQVRGQDRYYSLVIASATSRVHSLEDLRGRSFAFTDPLSNSGHLAPSWALHQRGEVPERFFSATSFTHSHDNSIRAIADGTYDGAAVDSLVYDFAVQREPSLAARTRIVYREGPFGMPPVVVRAGMDPHLKARLREVFLGIGDDEAASQVRQTLQVDRFVPADTKAYSSVRRMAATLRRWNAAP
jgi:phosphonate transport system substrate-binding protein